MGSDLGGTLSLFNTRVNIYFEIKRSPLDRGTGTICTQIGAAGVIKFIVGVFGIDSAFDSLNITRLPTVSIHRVPDLLLLHHHQLIFCHESEISFAKWTEKTLENRMFYDYLNKSISQYRSVSHFYSPRFRIYLKTTLIRVKCGTPI